MVFHQHNENKDQTAPANTADIEINAAVQEKAGLGVKEGEPFKARTLTLSLGGGGHQVGESTENKETIKISDEAANLGNLSVNQPNAGGGGASSRLGGVSGNSGGAQTHQQRPKLSLSGGGGHHRRDDGQSNRNGSGNGRSGSGGEAHYQQNGGRGKQIQSNNSAGNSSNNAGEREQNIHSAGRPEQTIYNLKELRKQSAGSLITMAESLNIDSPDVMAKHNLIFTILKRIAEQNLGRIYGEGVLEILPEGYGFLRSYEANYVASPDDIYVSQAQVKSYRLRTGDTISGPIRAPHNKNERYFALVDVVKLNGIEPSKGAKHRVHFDDLTPLYPDSLIRLESLQGGKSALSARVIDLMSPIGRGQRAIIVAPPKAGKTTLMQDIAHSIAENYPDITLIVLLIDERPEEVTDMARSVRGEVVSSTFDEPSSRHVQLTEMVIEKAKRLAEVKKDVVILLDSMTRLARAHNNVAPSSGKVLSGGVDSYALIGPKRFFGAARNLEEGGSITIIATALIDTGSRMDEVIFEEFKGTGNCEIVLDRKTSDRGTYPAIDLMKSGTRKDELLLTDEKTVRKVRLVKRLMSSMGVTEAVEFFLPKIRATRNNEEFLQQIDTYNQKTVKTMGDA